ncbi:serine hydroxymethyltransferase, putative [Plasmodium berghei]|uniref:Serine hydroxymethyltransferase, putative n=2 Tax=Plasmodium berghei TaxID=5821 RepID=A0A509AQG3_PLABA|nr:serine hydroxymethyltransferase, putative [Plasmodium berghei ANKA]CXI92796.1 serine hydroxymethyltransferase, putative [Plasmodium berghei]SCL96688.1 serine hydroxymethyltransferase, putative [Plasmodium berghei]SCM16473.1 serine hydroxymethyltransferase, putative [Plasmodium berghei]SCM18267.1 serine hydroxymethyltransferase, putative [Plasmodium berghei]SCN27695.1 serine hydroxymethyltransferase, putative [Plasmodium berghei]|eukprot:XP_034423350.1 serine hydroxymethyltransferase, putative [Plasmodium berghei ANKA]
MKIVKELSKNGKIPWRRFISSQSLQNYNSLKNVDEDNYNILSTYKNKSYLNLSVCNNIIPKYVHDCLVNNLNKNATLNLEHLKIIEDRALAAFNLENKYWGCVFNTSTHTEYTNLMDEYFLLKLFKNFVNYQSKIMIIIFTLLGKEPQEKNNKEESRMDKNILDEFYNILYIKNNDKINYMEIKNQCEQFNPDLIYIDETNNPYNFNYEFITTLRNIKSKINNKVYNEKAGVEDKSNTLVITNISNKASFIIGNFISSPFSQADIVFSYLNENIRANNCYIIFYRKGFKNISTQGKLIYYEYEDNLKKTYFQNNINNIICSLSTSFKCIQNCEFKEYIYQINKNINILFLYLNKKYFNIHFDPNNNFLNIACSNSLFNIQEYHMFCKKLNILFDIININKSTYVQNSFNIGTNYLTALGMEEHDMKYVSEFINQSILLYLHMKQKSTNSNLTFLEYLESSFISSDILALSNDIHSFVSMFPSPS